MLILSNEEIESFLTINDCIDALERAYQSWDKGTAINRPRTDLVMPSPSESGVYAFKSMEAGLYDPPIVAMRINSDIIRWNQQGNRIIKTKIPSAPGDKYVGLVMLFSTVTSEPLAMFPDGVVQRMRVASSSALAARYLSREDSSTLALFGSGFTQSALTTRVSELVVAAMMSAFLIASSGLPTAHTSAVTLACMSLTNASRLAFVGLNTLTRLIGRTAHIAGKWLPACQPEPNSSRVLEYSRER